MKRAAALLLLLLIAGCARPAERVVVAPAVAVVGSAEPDPAARNPPVGGKDMPLEATIAATIALAPNLSTLVRAVDAAGRSGSLAGDDQLTLFAPTDEAFGRLAPGTVDALLKPENNAALVKLVTLHLVEGRLSSAELVRRIAAGGGRATLTSVAGEPLTLTLTGSVVTLTDAGGNRSYVEVADVRERNGVIHVVNGVLVPRL